MAITIGHFNGPGLTFSPALLHAKELDFEQFLEVATPKITAITSNDQAQTFTKQTMGPFIEATLEQPTRSRRSKKHPLPPLLTDLMVTLGHDLAKWHFSSEMGQHLDNAIESLSTHSQNVQNAHLSWIKKDSSQTDFQRVLMLSETYADLAKTHESSLEEPPHFDLYAQYFFQEYPPGKKDNQGWLDLAENEGAQGIKRRLQEYWETHALSGQDRPVLSEEDRKSYSTRYLHHYFLPYLQMHLRTALLRIQVERKNHARVAWKKLRQWQIDQKQAKGLIRLCGTWQWLIHNHQNHGDHKTVMVYPPPSQYDRMDPQPAKIQVQGDTVYIRWKFPRGIIQEESLLFSEKDRALSGTFVNNLGPNGNITARRMKPCERK